MTIDKLPPNDAELITVLNPHAGEYVVCPRCGEGAGLGQSVWAWYGPHPGWSAMHLRCLSDEENALLLLSGMRDIRANQDAELPGLKKRVSQPGTEQSF